MRLLLAALQFYLLPMAWAVPALAEEPAARPVRLTVMTYNIHHANPPSAGTTIDLEAIAKVISKAKPDLVALQEVDVNTERSGKGLHQARELAKLTGMHFFFSKAIDHQGGDYGVAVLSRFPILDSMRAILPVDPSIGGETRTLAAVTVDLGKGRKLVFASTHLDLKEANRLSQSERILEQFKNIAYPIILAGDFNALPDSKVMQFWLSHFSRSCQSCPPTIPVKNPNRAIDFVLYRGGKFQAGPTKVVDEQYASDHLPVVVELRIE